MLRSVFIAAILLSLQLPVLGQQRMTNLKASIRHIKSDLPVSDINSSTWRRADSLTIASYWNGTSAPKDRQAEVRLLWSDSALYIRFEGNQSEPLVVSDKPQTKQKTMRLWDRDVCELFLAPDSRNRRRYFEYEIAPTGEWLDLIVDWMKDEPRDWGYESGMETFAKIEPAKVVMVMKIHWTAFSKKPEAGDVWLGNLFRQVGSGETRGYLTWSPTMTKTPQFHVPEKFGEFVFQK